MLRYFGRRLMVGAGALLMAGALYVYDQYNLTTNYTLVPAKVSSVTEDCVVKAYKSKLVDKTTNKIAYLPCNIAPVLAVANGFKETDVKRHLVVKYKFRSPVDRKQYTGTFERTGFTGKLASGHNIQVYAHKSEANNSRAPRGKLLLQKTGA